MSDSLLTLWTVACQVPLSGGFSRQEYWTGLSFPSPGDLPHPEIEPRSPALPADSLPSELPRKHKTTNKIFRRHTHNLSFLTFYAENNNNNETRSGKLDLMNKNNHANQISVSCFPSKKQNEDKYLIW